LKYACIDRRRRLHGGVLIPAAAAQQTQLPCATRADVIARLAAEYSKRVIFRGIA